MNLRYWTMLIVTLMLALALAGCSSRPAPKIAPIPTSTPSALAGRSSSNGGAMASGEIVPAQKALLSFPAAGRVQMVNVSIGEQVKVGDVIMSQEPARLEIELVRAKAGLEAAQAQLAQLKAAPQPAQVAVAEQAIKEAEAALRGATAQLAQLQASATQAQLTAAQARVADAAASLKLAQDAYQGVVEGRAAAKEYGIRLGGLGQAEEQMRARLAAVQAAYTAAQEQLAQVKAGATPSELDAARARVAAASAQKARAQAQLDLLKAGPTVEQVAVSLANVAQARATVELAQVVLEQSKLRAPWAGTVVAVNFNPGEMAVPGQAAIVLADFSRLQVETTDLSERDASRIAIGKPAMIRVKALSKEIKGQVVQIAPRATKVGGDVVYQVTIELGEQPSGLRWGMSVDMDIVD